MNISVQLILSESYPQQIFKAGTFHLVFHKTVPSDKSDLTYALSALSMILSRAKPAIQTPKEGENGGPSSASKKQLPKLDEFLGAR